MGGRSGPPTKTIKGKIVDAATGQGLEYATISVHSKRDSSIVGGGLSDGEGAFSIKVKGFRVYAVVDYISYETLIIDPIEMQKGVPLTDLGEIKLSAAAVELDDVEITAERSETTFSLDKKIFTVGKDLANRGGSAEDILDNVPSVAVDIEGVVSLRGSEGVRILIDGKPSGLVGSDNSGLRNIPSNLIQQVEVITNPSARYEAEGSAGIINIVLKKDQGHGFNGAIDVTAGIPESAGLSANLNYRKGPLNWFVNAGVNYRTGPGGGYNIQDRIIAQGTSEFRKLTTLDRNIDRAGYRGSLRFGADYFLTDKEQLTGAFVYSKSDRDSESNLIYNDYSDDNGSLGLEPIWMETDRKNFFDFEELENQLNDQTRYLETIRTDNEREYGDRQEINLNYRKEYDSRENNLNITAQYRKKSETEENVFGESISEIIAQQLSTLDQRANNNESEKTWNFQADYVKPLGKDHKWETGLRASFREILTDFLVEEKTDSDQFEVIPGFQNVFEYDEDIIAAYFIYGNRKGAFSYQLGLRGEQSNINTLLTAPEGSSEKPRKYFNLFPSGHLSYHFSDTDAVQLSYSRRIRRPHFWHLNPFYTYQDRRNFFSGNPNLDPQFTDSYELGSIKYWEGLSLSTAIFYRRTDQPTQRVLSIDNIESTTLRIPINIGTTNDYGLDISLTYSPAKWLRATFSTDAYRSIQSIDRTEAEASVFEFYKTVRNYDEDLNAFTNRYTFNANDTDNFTWNSRLTTKFTVAKSDLQLRVNYRGPRQTTQGYAQGIASVDIGWSKDFLPSKNLTLTLSVRDLFNSRKRTDMVFLDEFFQQSQFQWRARASTLTASYRINQKKKRGGGRPSGDYEGGGEF